MKSLNNFSAQLFVSADRTFFDRWEKPSKGISVQTAKKIQKGEHFFPLIIFNNPMKDATGRVRVTYKIAIVRPDGKKFADETLVAWEGVPRHGGMELGKEYLTVSIDPPDPYGIYSVNVVVKDEIGNTELPLSTTFEVSTVPIKKAEKLVSDKEMNQIITYFYLDKPFNKLGKVFKQLDQIPGWYDRGETTANFLEQVFKSYPSETFKITEDLKGISDTGQKVVWDALWLSGTKEGLYMLTNESATAKPEDKKYIQELLKKKLVPQDVSIIKSPSNLDSNWARFMVTGDDVYVSNIINVLNSDSKIITTPAHWSLTSNCEQHKKVFNIIVGQAQKVKDVIIGKELNEILKSCKRNLANGKAAQGR